MSLVGVPEPQRRMVLERPGGFPAFLRGCLDHVMSVGLLRENYFWSVYLNGSYTRESCPRVPQGRELRTPQGGPRRQRARPSRARSRSAWPGENRAVHRLRAARPHGLAGAAARACSRRSGRGSSAWRRPGARVIFRSGGKDELVPARSPSCAASASSASGRRSCTAATGSAPMPPSTSPASPPLSEEPARFGLDGPRRVLSPPRARSTTGRVRSCSSAAARRCGRSRCGRASACSTSAAAPAGACRRSARPGHARSGIEPSAPMRRQAAARLERRGLAGVVDARPAALRQPRRRTRAAPTRSSSPTRSR